ncbi:MAG: glycosyltransferase family 87 protein, partial [Candidatus Kariarchaeaceae archaeon]
MTTLYQVPTSVITRLSSFLNDKRVRQIILPSFLIMNIVPGLMIRFYGNQMYSFFFAFFSWIPIYIVFLFLLIFYNKSDQLKAFFESRQGLILTVIVTICCRLLFQGSDTSLSLDPLWYLDYGDMMLDGLIPYADFYFLYPPIFGYFILAISIVNPVIDSFRLLSTIFDVGIVCVLWIIIKKREYYTNQEILPLAFALLPISIIESGLHGHFEPIANLMLIISLWCLITGRYKSGAIMIGFSAATKIYAGFLIPILLLIVPSRRQKIITVSIAAITMFLTFIPFSIPVWLRGDFLFPGMPMPGTKTGIIDSTLAFLGRINVVQASSFFILSLFVIVIIS